MENEPEFEIIPDTSEEKAKWAKYKSDLPKNFNLGRLITYSYNNQDRLLGIIRPEPLLDVS